ncbi:MAG: transglycosylase domain-containing protein, partial [Clostridia bacterium]
MFKKKKVEKQEELPKAMLKMQQEKQEREEGNEKPVEMENIKRPKSKHNKANNKKITVKRIIIILIVIICIIVAIMLGISCYKWKTMAKDMFTNKNSIVVDTDGKQIAELGSERKKIKVDSDKMPEKLKDAYVSIEDERFYKHHGVDIKRTTSAIFSYVFHAGNSSYGGSTITQQLVKNITGDNTDSVTRKIKEWWKAYQLEWYFSKDDILDMYLNVIYVGPNIYGVGAGSEYYFNKDVQKLSIAESAFLAGINNSPNSYNPFDKETDNTEKINKRTKTVLSKMKELKYISEDEYNGAISEVENGLHFNKGNVNSGDGVYSYHTDTLITEVIKDIANEKKINETFASNYTYLSGLTIKSTQNSTIQKEVENEFNKKQYSIKSKQSGETAQAAMVIIDHTTGRVVATVGGLGEKNTARGLNRATQSTRQTGSSIKPLAVLIPGIDKKIFTASTIYSDVEKTFNGNYSPKNYDGYLGETTVRRAVESSQNIPFVEMMQQITPKVAIQYLENMGITTLTKNDESLTLSLGGLEKGITPLEMAAAYATIANNGTYIEPTFYTEVINKSGKVVAKAKPKTKKVISEQVAYIVKEILTQPVKGNNGTAKYCSISGMDVAAKTGTTDDNYDRWLCGFTPYYTAATWFGYDKNETIYFNKQNPAGIIWANVMKKVNSGLNKTKFKQPAWIQVATICSETGMVANSGCTNTIEEYFLIGTKPGNCTKHSGKKITQTENKNNQQEEENQNVFN